MFYILTPMVSILRFIVNLMKKMPQICRKLVGGGGNNGTQGMAEALAEIARRY